MPRVGNERHTMGSQPYDDANQVRQYIGIVLYAVDCIHELQVRFDYLTMHSFFSSYES